MTEDDWISVKIEKGLALEMDKFIASPASRHFGSRKYTSRSHLVKTAIIRLLEREARAITATTPPTTKKQLAAEAKSKN